jgi:hypothetical protein
MSEANEIPSEWYFITPPQSVNWSKQSRTNKIEPYGTNNPYLSYGTTGLRELSLSDSLVEGFSDGKSVEANILNLEACMRMVLNSEDGFAAPYCWEIYAGGKKYGTFVITSVNVDEQIRDAAGQASRAKVDIQFQEVAPYQVSSGIDITAEAITGSLNEDAVKAIDEKNAKDAAKNQDKNVNDSKTNDGKGNNTGDGNGTGADPTRTTPAEEIDTDTVLGNYFKS